MSGLTHSSSQIQNTAWGFPGGKNGLIEMNSLFKIWFIFRSALNSDFGLSAARPQYATFNQPFTPRSIWRDAPRPQYAKFNPPNTPFSIWREAPRPQYAKFNPPNTPHSIWRDAPRPQYAKFNLPNTPLFGLLPPAFRVTPKGKSQLKKAPSKTFSNPTPLL